MGGETHTYTHSKCSAEELDTWFSDLCSSDEREYGSDSYSGHLHRGDSLSIEVGTTFLRDEDPRVISKWCHKQVDKGEAIAVKIFKADRSPKDVKAREVKAKAQADALDAVEKLAGLTGFTLTNMRWNAPAPGEPLTLTKSHGINSITRAAFERAREGASNLRGCESCGSRVNVKKMQHAGPDKRIPTACPVCFNEDWLLNKADLAKRAKAVARQNQAVLKADAARKAYAAHTDTAPMANADWFWYIHAYCSS